MKVMFINNSGSGFADYIEVADGTTIEQFLDSHLPEYRPEDMLIRVNRLPVARDTVLQEGDRISATPTKLEGATPGSSDPASRSVFLRVLPALCL